MRVEDGKGVECACASVLLLLGFWVVVSKLMRTNEEKLTNWS